MNVRGVVVFSREFIFITKKNQKYQCLKVTCLLLMQLKIYVKSKKKYTIQECCCKPKPLKQLTNVFFQYVTSVFQVYELLLCMCCVGLPCTLCSSLQSSSSHRGGLTAIPALCRCPAAPPSWWQTSAQLCCIPW